jgi:hypothetical protein
MACSRPAAIAALRSLSASPDDRDQDRVLDRRHSAVRRHASRRSGRGEARLAERTRPCQRSPAHRGRILPIAVHEPRENAGRCDSPVPVGPGREAPPGRAPLAGPPPGTRPARPTAARGLPTTSRSMAAGAPRTTVSASFSSYLGLAGSVGRPTPDGRHPPPGAARAAPQSPSPGERAPLPRERQEAAGAA